MIRIFLNVNILLCLSLTGCKKSEKTEVQEHFTAGKAGLIVDSLWNPPAGAVYIDPSNSGDPIKDGTQLHPFANLINVKWKDNTTYALKRSSTIESGTIVLSANNITLCSYGDGDRPIIKSISKDYAVSTGFNGNASVTIRDLEIIAPQAVSCVLFRTNSSSCKVLNCKLHESEWGLRALNDISGLYVYNTEIFNTRDDGMFIQQTQQIEISHCYVHHVNQNWKSPETPESEAGGDGIQFNKCNHWNVHHSRIDRTTTGNKFCFISNNPTQDDGVFEYNELKGPLVNGFSIYIGDGKNMIFRYNVISGPSNAPLYSHASGLKVYYNIFKNITGPLFLSENAEVYNNLFYNMNALALQGGTITARNNIFDLGSVSAPRFKVTSLTEDHNIFAYGLPTSGSAIGKPNYVNPADGDFHLQSNSPCIDKGVSIGVVEDIDGIKVPEGNAPDIGPYEFK